MDSASGSGSASTAIDREALAGIIIGAIFDGLCLMITLSSFSSSPDNNRYRSATISYSALTFSRSAVDTPVLRAE